jgi:hypothetical protein
MGTKAHGRILFWEGASLWILSAPSGERFSGVAIAIAPDASHAFGGTGLVAHLFVASDKSEPL